MNIWVNRVSSIIDKYGNAFGQSDNIHLFITDIDYTFQKSMSYTYVDGVITEVGIRPSAHHQWENGRWVNHKPTLPFYEKRLNEYPQIAEQLDMLWHAMDTGEIPKATAWYNAIKDIKTKHPKG